MTPTSLRPDRVCPGRGAPDRKWRKTLYAITGSPHYLQWLSVSHLHHEPVSWFALHGPRPESGCFLNAETNSLPKFLVGVVGNVPFSPGINSIVAEIAAYTICRVGDQLLKGRPALRSDEKVAINVPHDGIYGLDQMSFMQKENIGKAEVHAILTALFRRHKQNYAHGRAIGPNVAG